MIYGLHIGILMLTLSSAAIAEEKLELRFPLTKEVLSLQKNHLGHWVSKACADQKEQCIAYRKTKEPSGLIHGVSGEAQRCGTVGGAYQVGRDPKGNEWGVCLTKVGIAFDAAILLGSEE
jgi:hypothetical protein